MNNSPNVRYRPEFKLSINTNGNMKKCAIRTETSAKTMWNKNGPWYPSLLSSSSYRVGLDSTWSHYKLNYTRNLLVVVDYMVLETKHLVKIVDCKCGYHYIDVMMGTMASQITSLMAVYSIVYSGADERKRQSSTSLAFVRGIHRWLKGPVTRKMFPFDDVIMTKDGSLQVSRCNP